MKTITIAKGDGIGPEIMDATLQILNASEAKITFEEIEIGEQPYLKGLSSGIAPEAWASIRREKVDKEDILLLLQNALKNNVDVIKTENLYSFDGKPAFSLGQGQ